MPSAAISCAPCHASGPRWPLRHARLPSRWQWATSCCLLALSTGCGLQQGLTVTPIPPSLDRPCHAGPPIPDGEVRVGALLELWAQREAAARECRARVEGLRAAWPR